jgi:hypothetical protein
VRKLETWIVVLAAVLGGLPLLVLPWMAVFRLLVGLFPSAAPLYLMELPAYFFFWLLSSLPRYLALNAAVLSTSIAALTLVCIRLRGCAWRSARFYLSLLGIVAVLALPLWMHYRPAAEPLPGVELRQVDPPGLLQGVVKWAQVAVEQSEVQYEPLGWTDAQTLVYRLWRGGHYEGENWVPGGSQGLYAYNTVTARVTAFSEDPETIVREFCARAECVKPRLSDGPAPYFPGHYATTLLSPDGRWAAFTVRHTYGPEDLLVMVVSETVGVDVAARGSASSGQPSAISGQ